jgi:hypothetical protein
MVIHGAVMVVAGVGFGDAVIRARVFPAWTGLSLTAGVILVAITQDATYIVQLTSAGVRDVAFAGMGVAPLRRARHMPESTFASTSPPPAVGATLAGDLRSPFVG